jgi:hypothetical protein
MEARIKQLEAERDAAIADRDTAVSRADTAQARVGALESEGSDRHYAGDKPVLSATRNKPTWPFLVHCVGIPKNVPGKPLHPDVPDEVIHAVDESEAIRQFCLMRKDDQGRQLDVTRYAFIVTCQKEKARHQLTINRLNNRRLVNAGKLRVLDREQELRVPEKNLAEMAIS